MINLARKLTSAVNLYQDHSVKRELLLFKRWKVVSVVAYTAPMLGLLVNRYLSYTAMGI